MSNKKLPEQLKKIRRTYRIRPHYDRLIRDFKINISKEIELYLALKYREEILALTPVETYELGQEYGIYFPELTEP